MMELRLLGTGSADGIPAMVEDSRVSQYAREHRGRDIRSRAAALVDGQLKIDLPPDTWAQMARDGLTPKDWSALLFTHSDRDHLAPAELQYFLFPFTADTVMPFPIFANHRVAEIIEHFYPDWPIEIHRTQSFVPFVFGEYSITPIRAHHSRGEDCHNLIISNGTETLLYATDTGLWSEETWEFLAQQRLDALVLECTDGRMPSNYYGHMNLESCVATVDRLRTLGTLHDDALAITTHHSHRGDMTYQELTDALAPHRMESGYDGMVVAIHAQN